MPKRPARRFVRGFSSLIKKKMFDGLSTQFARGVAREIWQHSIPPVDMLRYSVTFRSLRESKER
jgi:hypothetical protein